MKPFNKLSSLKAQTSVSVQDSESKYEIPSELKEMPKKFYKYVPVKELLNPSVK